MPEAYFTRQGQVLLDPLSDTIAFGVPIVDTGRLNVSAAARTLIPNTVTGTIIRRELMSRSRVVLASADGRPSDLAARLYDTGIAKEGRFVTPVYRERESGLRLALTDEVTVSFKVAPNGGDLRDLAGKGLVSPRQSRFDPRRFIFSVDVGSRGRRALEAANELFYRPGVMYAHPNFLAEYTKEFAPTGQYWSQHWHLDNSGQDGGRAGEDIRALGAWNICRGAESIVVAVLDDGVDANHPALRGAIWTNPAPDAELNDSHGYSFYDETNDSNPRYFKPPYNELAGNDIHGTPCAGIIAAHDEQAGVYGVAFGVKILPVKVWGEDKLVPLSVLADAIRYAGARAAVINCSWKCPPNDDVHQAIIDVTTTGRQGLGVPVFCSAGNASQFSVPTPLAHPARYREAIAIGASTNLAARAGYSHYGDGLDIVAPSSGGTRAIFTTDVSLEGRGFNLAPLDSADFGGLYTNMFGGTSAAAPVAAGVAALLLSVKPTLTAADVRQVLRDTADKIDAPTHYKNGLSVYYGYGRINAERALSQVLPS